MWLTRTADPPARPISPQRPRGYRNGDARVDLEGSGWSWYPWALIGVGPVWAVAADREVPVSSQFVEVGRVERRRRDDKPTDPLRDEGELRASLAQPKARHPSTPMGRFTHLIWALVHGLVGIFLGGIWFGVYFTAAAMTVSIAIYPVFWGIAWLTGFPVDSVLAAVALVIFMGSFTHGAITWGIHGFTSAWDG